MDSIFFNFCSEKISKKNNELYLFLLYKNEKTGGT